MKIAALSACVRGAAAKFVNVLCATRAWVNEKGRTQTTYNKSSVVIHWQTINIDTLSRFEMQTVVCKHGHCLIKFYIYKFVYLFLLINCHSFRSFGHFYRCDTNSRKMKIVQWFFNTHGIFHRQQFGCFIRRRAVANSVCVIPLSFDAVVFVAKSFSFISYICKSAQFMAIKNLVEFFFFFPSNFV